MPRRVSFSSAALLPGGQIPCDHRIRRFRPIRLWYFSTTTNTLDSNYFIGVRQPGRIRSIRSAPAGVARHCLCGRSAVTARGRRGSDRSSAARCDGATPRRGHGGHVVDDWGGRQFRNRRGVTGEHRGRVPRRIRNRACRPAGRRSASCFPSPRATETTTVVAPTLPSSSPTASMSGSNLTATTVARLPSSRLKARESLPLLPSMVRGADGLLRLGGARPYETPLLLDGFNVTNPATGTSNINLPFESVEGVEVLRDPMAVVYGGLLGGLVQMVSKPGGDTATVRRAGIYSQAATQSARASDASKASSPVCTRRRRGRRTAPVLRRGRIRLRADRRARSHDRQRPEPGRAERDVVRTRRRPAARSIQLDDRNLAFPSATDNVGLSTRGEKSRRRPTSPSMIDSSGVTNRIVLEQRQSRVNQRRRHSRTTRRCRRTATDPRACRRFGWRRNWFASVERHAIRYSVAASWDRTLSLGRHGHALGVTANMASQRLRGSVAESPVLVEDERGRVVRRVEFGAPSTLTGERRARRADGARRLDRWQPTAA